MVVIRHGVEVKGTDLCPVVTVKGTPKCLDLTCYMTWCKYPKVSNGETPDLLVNMSILEFKELFEQGYWNSEKRCYCGEPIAKGYVNLCMSCLRKEKAHRQRIRRL